MTFRQLEYLCALVEEGSICKAAKTLFISQPALSQQIISIEKEYDVEILNRNKDPHTITEAGLLCYDAAQKILTLKENLVNELKNEKCGKLHIKTIPFYAHTLVPYIFSQLKKSNVNKDFKIYDADTGHLFLPQRNENIDLYIHAFDMNEIVNLDDPNDSYIHQKLCNEKIMLATYLDNPIMTKVSYFKQNETLRYVKLSDLKKENFVTTTTSNFLRSKGQDLCRNIGGFEPRFLVGEPTFVRLMGFLQFNNCIAFMPDTVLKYSNIRSNIEFFNIEGAETFRIVVASHLKDKKLSPIADSFITMAKKLL